MFCLQCGLQAEQQPRVCKACGYKLTEHARLLADLQELERVSTKPARALRASQPEHKANSVTEHTTRELYPVPATQRSIKGAS